MTKTSNLCKLIVLLVISILVVFNSAKAQTDGSVVPFNKADYPDTVFVITTQSYSHGSCMIKLIQVKDTAAETPSMPFICRAWLSVSKGKKVLHQIYFAGIDPVGSSYGIYIPNYQPPGRFFAVVKEGDYDGILYLIDMQGRIRKYLGGSYFVSRWGRYLFSQYDSDEWTTVVIDLETGDSLSATPDSFPYPSQWYRARKGYYFYTSTDTPDSMFTWKANSKVFTAQVLNPRIVAASDKVGDDFSFSPPANNDCGCADR